MNALIGKDLFGFWLACVSCAVVAAAGATAGWQVLRPATQEGDPRVIPVALAALPDPEPAEEGEFVAPEPVATPLPTAASPVIASPLPDIAKPDPPAPADETPVEIAAKTPREASPETPQPPEPVVEASPPSPSPQAQRPVAAPPASRAPARLARPASVLRQAQPRYPRSARRAGREGTTQVEVRLSSAGRILGAHVSRSSGDRALDTEALRAVRRWTFAPARSASGKPIESRVRVPIRFELE